MPATPPTPKPTPRQDKPESFRLGLETLATLDELERRFGLGKTACMRAGVALLAETLDRASTKDALSLAESLGAPRKKSAKPS